MKFILFVEGEMEDLGIPAFLRTWLNGRLTERVGVDAVKFHGAGDLINETPQRAKRYLNSPKQDVIAVIALLDLYGCPFPYSTTQLSTEEKLSAGKKYLEERVNLPNFRQFFAVHETEAWLLSDASIFPDKVAENLKDKSRSPENVNFDQPPSKLIAALYRSKMQSGYGKRVVGAKLLRQLNPEIAYAKCPHLKALLDTMHEMAEAAGRQEIGGLKADKGGE